MKDLCLTCKHHWIDFPTPLEEAIPHCDIVDKKHGLVCMDEMVSFPCTKCPFNSYEQK